MKTTNTEIITLLKTALSKLETPDKWQIPAPPEGHSWHRTDGWMQDMLPDGWRPLLEGEKTQSGDECLQYNVWTPCFWHALPSLKGMTHIRTRRPLPSRWQPIRDAFLRGERVEYQVKIGNAWSPWSGMEYWDRDEKKDWRWTDDDYRFRLAPKPVLVPLGAKDVPPGSALRLEHWDEGTWRSILNCYREFIQWNVGGGVQDMPFRDLKIHGWLILRPGATEWVKCEKEAK